MAGSSRQVDSLQKLGFLNRTFPAQELDLTSAAAAVVWDVGDYRLGSIHLAGTNTVAVLELERSFDGGQNFETFNPRIRRLGSGRFRGIPLDQVNQLRLKVLTADGAGTTEEARAYADQARPSRRPRKVLAQVYQTVGGPTAIYSPTGQAEISGIVIDNPQALDAEIELFLDDDGTTYDSTTALATDWTIYTHEPPVVWSELGWPISYPGNLALTVNSQAVTVTVFGWEA